MATIIHSARLVTDGAEHPDSWALLADGRVAALGDGDGWLAHAVEGMQLVDAGGTGILTPGFVDIHGHGGAGAGYEEGVDAIRTARAFHRQHGTTRAVLSLVTAPLPALEEQVGVIAGLTGTDGILGSHLEGPFLDPAHKGAHSSHLLRELDAEALGRLLDAGAGTVRHVTLAPERPGADAAIARALASGAAVAVGHTGADLHATARAFDAGATILTHAFNAMPGLHHRAPGPVGAALGDPRITLEAIADGAHLHPRVLAVLFAAAPGRIALVTDAMAAAGNGDGSYALGGLDVVVERGVARLADGDTIAGSTLTQDAALRTAVAAGVPLPDAVAALTSVPARAVGVAGDYGSLRVGSVGDAVLLHPDLTVRAVFTPT